MCLGMGEGEKKFQEASGNGNHEAAWEGREGKALQTRPYSPFQRPSLTQGSLADVRAGGPSNNKLRVIADLLGTRPTECCQAARHMFLGLGHLHSQWVHFLPPSPRESFADCHGVFLIPLPRGTPMPPTAYSPLYLATSWGHSSMECCLSARCGVPSFSGASPASPSSLSPLFYTPALLSSWDSFPTLFSPVSPPTIFQASLPPPPRSPPSQSSPCSSLRF